MKTHIHKIFGCEKWAENTYARVEISLIYFNVSVWGMFIFYNFFKPREMTPAAGILWCFLCGLVGIGFRAWQYRMDKDEKDQRGDANKVTPPFPAYIVDYPVINLINSVAVFLFSMFLVRTFSGLDFYFVALPISVYFGSAMKLVNPKWP